MGMYRLFLNRDLAGIIALTVDFATNGLDDFIALT
jgi:hypothetical protein